jgi:hypothetical protein
MEHILEVIKDLTFKNTELTRQVSHLKQQLDEERHFKHLYDEIYAERKQLIDKNLMVSNELSRYR